MTFEEDYKKIIKKTLKAFDALLIQYTNKLLMIIPEQEKGKVLRLE